MASQYECKKVVNISEQNGLNGLQTVQFECQRQGLSWPNVKLDIFPTYLRSDILLIEVADMAKCEDGLIYSIPSNYFGNFGSWFWHHRRTIFAM